MKSALFVIALFMGAAHGVWAQDRSPLDPVNANFFHPRLVIDNQAALGLTEEQKMAIKKEAQKAQTSYDDLEWQIRKESEAMATLLKPDRVEETKALGQLDKLMGLERDIKRIQLTLMVRIKNNLSAEQQMILRKLKAETDDHDR